MALRASAAKTAVKEKLAAVLPALLTAAGLDGFTDYLDEQPSDPQAVQLGVYIDREEDSGDYLRLSLIIQAQLYGKGDWKQAYHGVLMEAIRKYITATLVDYVERDSIEGDPWPVDQNATSFCYYVINFSEPLDSCDGGGYYEPEEEEEEE